MNVNEYLIQIHPQLQGQLRGPSKRHALRIAAALAVAALASTLVLGCTTIGRVPEFQSVEITPTDPMQSEQIVVTVDLADRFGVVQRVVARPKGWDSDEAAIVLNDEGSSPDQEAGDGVWTGSKPIRWNSMTGDYTLEIIAYDEDGEVVAVPGEQGYARPLQAEVDFTIRPLPEDADLPMDGQDTSGE